MLTTLRRDRRARRRANFDLESLDDRLVLSAAAVGAVAEAAGSKAAIIDHRQEVRAARHEAKLARMEARHEAKLARMEAPHAATLAKSADPMAPAPVTPAAVVASASTPAPAATVATGTSASPRAPVLMPTNIGSSTSNSGTGTTSGSGSSSTATLPTNVAAALQSLYQEYESQGGGSSFTPGQPSDKPLQISGTSVEVSLKVGSGSDFSTALSQLQSDGLRVSSSSSTYGLIDGMLPIGVLPAAAQIAASATAVPAPHMK